MKVMPTQEIAEKHPDEVPGRTYNTVIFLQNSWRHEIPWWMEGRFWPRDSWLYALNLSRSGWKLKLLGLDPETTWLDNTTREVGVASKSVCKPDPEYIALVLRRAAPTLVVVCGELASLAVGKLWDGPLLKIPHPASRTLTNHLYRVAGERIAKGEIDRMEIAQCRGFVNVIDRNIDVNVYPEEVAHAR